ncbi:YKL212Wp-like protein [Endogone sp. FLAS-F59071]|nr:YKL212Wp-like protein [Endogone sp. FLAS-F59071]|eukprot:RUS17025.1 YKL212Wp-like protein [Endogone sp. FLAS-F59071]
MVCISNPQCTFSSGEYMIVITNRERIGRLSGHDIFRVTSFQILPLPRNLLSLSESQTTDEQTYVHLLETHLKSNAFYFSYTYDLTQSLQRQAQLPQSTTKSLWQRADDRFFWNRHISSKLIEATLKGQNLSNFILPIMQGFIEILTTQINSKPFIFALISRRSRFRAGTRYFSRGIDTEGHVSNFIESEQLLLTDPPAQPSAPWPTSQQIEGHTQISYVQVRGSLPLFWAQVNDLNYSPKMRLKEGTDSTQAARRHFDELLRIYGRQILVNLTNTKGYELPVGQAYERIVDELHDDRLRYIHFDFHKECSNMRWHRIQLLLDQLEEDLVQQR